MSITFSLILITVATSIYAWNHTGVFQKWMMHPYQIHTSGQYYRFLTSGFLHSNLGHLAFNMITFYFFGGVIEQAFNYFFGAFGAYYFIGLYLLGIIISDIPSYLKHKHNVHFSAIGASGGVSAVLFSSILINPLSQICLYFFICLPGFVLGALYLAYTVYWGKNAMDNINHDAHLYGSIFGVVFTAILRPSFITEFINRLSDFTLL